MTSEIAAMLDELMGRNRNEEAGKSSNKGIYYRETTLSPIFNFYFTLRIKFRFATRKSVNIIFVVFALMSSS